MHLALRDVALHAEKLDGDAQPAEVVVGRHIKPSQRAGAA